MHAIATMGIIQRQSVKNSLVNFGGFFIGVLSTLFIFPKNFEIYGHIQYWMAIATLLSPFLNLGSFSLVEKYFPYFKERKIPGFMRLILIATAVSILCSLVLLFVFGNTFKTFIEPLFNSTVAVNEYTVVIVLGILLGLINIMRIQSANHQRIVFPDIANKLGFKFFLPFIFLLFINQFISFKGLEIGLVLFFVCVLLALIFYLVKINAWDVFSNKAVQEAKGMKKEMGSYMLINMFNEVSHSLTYKIDVIMLGALISKSAAGIYSLFIFLAAVIDIPSRSVYEITAPFVASSFEKNDMNKIEELYKKSSLNLFVVGVFLFGVIWLNMDNILAIMTNGSELVEFKIIFVFLGLAKLADMLTSINKHILVYSSFYKYNLILVIILAIVAVVTNYYFIELYGIKGAAFATAISIFIFQMLRSLFLYVKFKMHPFTQKTIPLLIILVVILFLGPYVQKININPFVAGVLISGSFSLIYFSIVHKLKVSEDMYHMFASKLKPLLSRFDKK